MYETELKNFIDAKQHLKSYPSKRKMQVYALFFLAEKFEADKVYSEMDVNLLIDEWTSFSDSALLRRDLVNSGFLSRTRDGREYRKCEVQPTFESFGV